MQSLKRQKVLVDVGSGSLTSSSRTPVFRDWHHVRVDIDPRAQPDIIADLIDLSPIADETADAIWSSHSLEHLYQHQVGVALAEFYRVLNSGGFMVALVPDLQAVAEFIGSEPVGNCKKSVWYWK